MFFKIYQGTEHGFYAQSFHYKCDKKGPTFSIIETTTGRLFGGYSTKSWSTKNKVYSDNTVFIFSLDRMKYLKYKKDANNVGCFKKELIYFQDAICLKDKCDQKFNCLVSMNNNIETTHNMNI